MTTKTILYHEDVRYEPTSMVDKSGRLFYWNDRVFREITDESAWKTYQILLKSVVCPKLFEAGLIETWIPEDICLEGSIGILEHKKIDFVSYCSEWTPKMLWHAAKMIAECAKLLAQEKLTLKDGHPWNVLFDYCKPKWVDFGSITCEENSYSSLFDEFRIYYITPLWLYKFGGSFGRKIVLDMMHEHTHGMGQTTLRSYPMHFFPIRYYLLTRKYLKAIRSDDDLNKFNFFKKLLDYIQSLEPIDIKEEWADYQQGEINALPQQLRKQKVITEVVKSLNPESVLDMGANKGAYSFIVENLGCKVVAFDREAYCVDQIYTKSQNLEKKVLPLKMDFLRPTPETGLGLTMGTSFDRLECDVTLVLGMVHHLVLHQGVRYSLIADIVSRYSRKAAIIEYIDPTDEHIKNWNIISEYNKQILIDEMQNKYLMLVSEQKISESRSILIFMRNYE